MEELPPMPGFAPVPPGMMDMSASSSVPAPTPIGATGQAARGPITLKGFLRPTEPAKPKKDDDSIQNMLERLQGNAQQTKEAVQFNPMSVPGSRMNMQVGMNVLGQEDDPRTRSDYEFEAFMNRMLAPSSGQDIDHISRELLIKFSSFNPQQLTELMPKIDGAPGLQSGSLTDLLAELIRMLMPRLKEFATPQFTQMTSTLASWARNAERKRQTRFSEFSKAFFNAASQEMSSRLMAFAPHELNCCLAAFVSVGHSEHKFFASVGRAALARHTSFAPVQLTALLAILSEMRLTHTDLFNAAGLFLAGKAQDLRPVDMVRVLRSFAKCNVQHKGLCQAVADEVLSRLKSKTATFKPEELVELCWALCVLQQYHDGLFRATFKALEKSPTISSDALLQVYECHLALEGERKDDYKRYRIDRDLVEALEDHYKDNRKDERRCSEKHRNDVASVLKSLVDGSVHVNHRTSNCLLVDVAALRKRSSTDGFIHVDLDSNTTSVRSLDSDEVTSASLLVEGAVALRRRILQKAGLRLVTVRESEWRDLDDSKEKRRHLRNLLSNLGDVLE